MSSDKKSEKRKSAIFSDRKKPKPAELNDLVFMLQNPIEAGKIERKLSSTVSEIKLDELKIPESEKAEKAEKAPKSPSKLPKVISAIRKNIRSRRQSGDLLKDSPDVKKDFKRTRSNSKEQREGSLNRNSLDEAAVSVIKGLDSEPKDECSIKPINSKGDLTIMPQDIKINKTRSICSRSNSRELTKDVENLKSIGSRSNSKEFKATIKMMEKPDSNISKDSEGSSEVKTGSGEEADVDSNDGAMYELLVSACSLMALENTELINQLPSNSNDDKPGDEKEASSTSVSAEDLESRNEEENKADSTSDDEDRGARKKIDMKLKLNWLRKKSDASVSVRPNTDEVQGWAESFQNLMASKYGQSLFKAFLQREFSEENVEFWLAVEEYRKVTKSSKMVSKASKIHADFVAVQAPKEINLDFETRDDIAKALPHADKTIFDTAQKRVQLLMESDAYQRFLQSEFYKDLLHPEPAADKSD